MKAILFGLACCLLVLSACNSAVSENNTANQEDSSATSEANLAQADEVEAEAKAAADEAATPKEQVITVSGQIKEAIIDPYPMGSLTFLTDAGETLSLYFEGTTVEMEQLPSRVGEKATITYRIKNDKAVMDVLLGDETIMGDIDHRDDWKMLQGTLIAKEENQGGDLPGFFELKLADGSTETFEAFFTDAMITHSGKEVYLFYDERQTLVLENVQ